MTTNQLSFYASFLRFQAQLAKSGCNEAIISALRETEYDQPMEEEEAIIPSPSPLELAPPSAVGQDKETTNLTTALQPPPPKWQTRSVSSRAGYVIPSIPEPLFDDDSEQEGSLT